EKDLEKAHQDLANISVSLETIKAELQQDHHRKILLIVSPDALLMNELRLSIRDLAVYYKAFLFQNGSGSM
ncbi:MAG: hypothetical protein Q8730_02635, partial [Sweet potato little leaf phytoplasma]|nr:hypothetical protein [Sweet potato little leaf phytoplasma]